MNFKQVNQVFNQRWSLAGIGASVTAQNKLFELQVIRALSFIGEEFVNKARNNADFVDRTGNLRSSIGYMVFNNRDKVQENILKVKGGQEGVTAAKNFESQINVEDGFVLIVFAGMEYAIYVEASGRDVLTGSAPGKSKVKSLLKDLL